MRSITAKLKERFGARVVREVRFRRGMTPDAIQVAGLALNVRIGVTERERAAGQRLSGLADPAARPVGSPNLEDRIEHTLNYSAVCVGDARELARHGRAAPADRDVRGRHCRAPILAGFPACAEVDVELRKYILPDTDYVAVRLTRRQPP